MWHAVYGVIDASGPQFRFGPPRRHRIVARIEAVAKRVILEAKLRRTVPVPAAVFVHGSSSAEDREALMAHQKSGGYGHGQR